MIALDTNVLVRLIVDDPDTESARQSKRARRLVDETVDDGDVVLLTNVVLCEFVWVLRSAYRVERADVARALDDLLVTEHVAFESPEAVARATASFAAGPADFADYLIVEIAADHGCDAVYTFDSKLSGEEGIEEP